MPPITVITTIHKRKDEAKGGKTPQCTARGFGGSSKARSGRSQNPCRKLASAHLIQENTFGANRRADERGPPGGGRWSSQQQRKWRRGPRPQAVFDPPADLARPDRGGPPGRGRWGVLLSRP